MYLTPSFFFVLFGHRGINDGRLGCNQRDCDGLEEAYISASPSPDKPLCLMSGFTMGVQAIYTTTTFYKAARRMSAGKGSVTLGLVILDNMEFIGMLSHIKQKI